MRIKQDIHLFELANSSYGLIISPMLASFVPDDDVATAFDPHRHDSYGLFLLRSGRIRMMVEGLELIMEDSSLLLVQPGQIHQSIESKDVSGWVIFFDSKNLDMNTRTITEQSVEDIAIFQLSPDELLFADRLLSSIHQAYEHSNFGPFLTQILHSLVNALFYQVANMHLARKSANKSFIGRPRQIVQEFKDLIKSHFKSLKKPSGYAEQMHISVSYLNDTVKAQTGYTATHLIQQEVIGEAKKQLKYSTKSIKEIAINLGYDDYKYFIRLFTKIVNSSPSVFRQDTKTIARG